MNIIKKFRGELGLNQQELAEKCGVSRYFVSMNESDKYPKIEKLEIAKRFSNFFGISLIEFYGLGVLKTEPQSKEDYDFLINLLMEERRNKYGD